MARSSAFVWNKRQFDEIDPAATKHLLGLFDRSDMEFEHDRAGDAAGEPSLSEMTAKAIDMLNKALALNPKGFDALFGNLALSYFMLGDNVSATAWSGSPAKRAL